MPNLSCWRRKWALVTGASSGIGLAFAEELATLGVNLVLTARRRDRLELLQRRLEREHGVMIETFPSDLTQEDATQDILAFTDAREFRIDILVNNAGIGSYGEFHASELDRELDMVRLNCAAVVSLTHGYLARMVKRRSGDILIVASTGAYQAVPYMATYAASKAFGLLFAEALAAEVRRYGVRVCALCPGPTESEFVSVARVREDLLQRMDDPNRVARVGLNALAAGEYSVIPGYANWLGVQAQRLAPRRFVTSTAEAIFRPER
jgi:short-subunit dehydrogenase